MIDVVAELREELVAAGLVRRPNDDLAPAARPWPPPAWKHPDDGAIGPGDAADQDLPTPARDDGLVVSLMWAPGMAPEAGAEDRIIYGVDVVYRGRAVPAIVALDGGIRDRLLGVPPRDPGGRTGWIMNAAAAGGMAPLYVIQSRIWSPFQAVSSGAGVFTFRTAYLFETRA